MVLKSALRKIQREMREEPPRHATVVEYLEAANDGRIDLGFPFQNPLLPPPVPSSVDDSFAARLSYHPPFLSSFQLPPRGEGSAVHHLGHVLLPLLGSLLLTEPNRLER